MKKKVRRKVRRTPFLPTMYGEEIIEKEEDIHTRRSVITKRQSINARSSNTKRREEDPEPLE